MKASGVIHDASTVMEKKFVSRIKIRNRVQAGQALEGRG